MNTPRSLGQRYFGTTLVVFLYPGSTILITIVLLLLRHYHQLVPGTPIDLSHFPIMFLFSWIPVVIIWLLEHWTEENKDARKFYQHLDRIF